MTAAGNISIWYPGNIGDETSDWLGMTTEEVGAYALLRQAHWLRGWLPADEGFLARLCRMTGTRWRKHVAPRLLRLFTVRDGLLVNDKWDAERQRAIKNSEKKSLSARGISQENPQENPQNSGPLPNEINDLGPAYVQRMPEHPSTPLPVQIEDDEDEDAGAREGLQRQCQEGLEQALDDLWAARTSLEPERTPPPPDPIAASAAGTSTGSIACLSAHRQSKAGVLDPAVVRVIQALEPSLQDNFGPERPPRFPDHRDAPTVCSWFAYGASKGLTNEQIADLAIGTMRGMHADIARKAKENGVAPNIPRFMSYHTAEIFRDIDRAVSVPVSKNEEASHDQHGSRQARPRSSGCGVTDPVSRRRGIFAALAGEFQLDPGRAAAG